MASKDPLIRHAITPPAFDGRNSIHRERLVDAIHENVPRKLIAIAAPAGYGKTTLLADFGAHTELTVCWVRLTEADWDVMRFAQVLAASLQSRFRRLKGQPDLEALASSTPEALAVAFATAIDAQIADPFVIAIDEVHLINQSKPVLQFFDRFLEDLPEQVTVVAAGREVLEVSLARLMADRDLAGFGPHDLALTREELVELTEMQQGERLPEAEIERLLEESRGWVTGIVMSGAIADLGAGSLIGGGRPMVYEYLASVVLNRQPDDLRRFMLDASVLPVMTTAACNSVLQKENSRRYLTQLVRKGLFVTASETSPRTYEFHPLFREFLLESAEGADSKRLKSLRRQAAEYHLEEGSPEHAVDLLIEAGALSRAARLADRNSRLMFSSGRVQTLEKWEDSLKEHHDLILNLLLYLAEAQRTRGHFEEVESLLAKVIKHLSEKSPKQLRARYQIAEGLLRYEQARYAEAIEAAEAIDALFKRRGSKRLKGLALRIRALALFYGEGDPAEAEALATKAADYLSAANDDYVLVSALMSLSAIQWANGKTREAAQTDVKVLDLAKAIGAPLLLTTGHGNSALNAHEAGDYELALANGREALKYARLAASPLREAIALLRQADVFSDIGLALQSADLYRQALDILVQIDNPLWIRYACIQTSILHRRRGGIALAHEWLKRAIVVSEGADVPPGIRIQQAALEIEAAPKKAINSLRKLVEDGSEKIEAQELTQARYFMARAERELHGDERARHSFVDVLANAGRYGMEQPIAAELHFDPEFRGFAIEHYATDPTYAVIEARIASMLAMEARYEATSSEGPAEVMLAMEALGSSRVLVNGLAVEDLKPLAREILFYIVDHDRVARDRLMDAFWPEQPAGRQVSSLHTAIYGIRRELGKDMIQFDGAFYTIHPDSSLLYDVARFEQAAAAAERLPPGDPRLIFALTEGVNSYGGAFLPEMDSEWVDERRRSLEFRYVDLLAVYSEEALIQGQPAEAVGRLRIALAIDPLRDDTNKYYLEALGQLGRRSEIVTHYQDYVRRLADELGLDPPEEMRGLYDRLIS